MTAPHDLAAEEAVLGACMLVSDAIDRVAEVLRPDDLYRPAHVHIYDALLDLRGSGGATDAVGVANWLRTRGLLEQAGGTGHLVHLQAAVPSTTNAARYATQVVEHAGRRKLLAVATELTKMASSAADLTEVLDEARVQLEGVELPLGSGQPSRDLDEFLAGPTEYQWLVKGVLERQERLLLVGGEGLGKSMLLRQMGVMMSQGIHPFSHLPIPPVRVLLVDLENPEVLVRRKMARMAAQARLQAASYNPDTMRVALRQQGLDLTRRADVLWLMERVKADAPDVLIVGPVYKMHTENPNDEAPARKLAHVLDTIRERWDVAMLLETHAPHGSTSTRTLRPMGASLWLRWPEFGLSIAHDEEVPGRVIVGQWRGGRDERDWPSHLYRSQSWPWLASQPNEQAQF